MDFYKPYSSSMYYKLIISYKTCPPPQSFPSSGCSGDYGLGEYDTLDNKFCCFESR